MSNLGIHLDKNVYQGTQKQTLLDFLKEFEVLCKDKEFNVEFTQVVSLASYENLIKVTAQESVEYVANTIQKFYTDFIESIKDELY
ncbi:hypothetical protein FRX51_01960 [Streptococcus sp. sy010]|nr:hypothetical protein FRX51_01960 [Streptococcus sp. sy010]